MPVINNFAERRRSNSKIGEDKTRLARTEDVVTYTEFCKPQLAQPFRRGNSNGGCD